MGQRFEFIPCTCPESEEKKHGHIYDNSSKINSPHIYSTEGGLHFIQSLPSGEATKENINLLTVSMDDLFNPKVPQQ